MTEQSESVAVLIQKIETLTNGMQRLESLIAREIDELKSEQIADLKRQNERLADDQRRAWDAIRTLENQKNQNFGSFKAVQAIVVFVSTLFGAAIAAFVTKYVK